LSGGSAIRYCPVCGEVIAARAALTKAVGLGPPALSA
jgi:hypothetical protein